MHPVSVRRLALVLFLGLVVASQACAKGGPNGHSKVATPDDETTIEGPDGVVVVVPKGALEADARITVQALPPTRRPGNAVAVADGVRLLPEGQEFKTGVQVTIPITPSMLPAGKTVDDVVVMRAEQNGDVFVPLPTRRNGNAVVAQTEHFSDFVAVVAMEGQSIPCVDTYCSGNETCETCPIDCGLCTAPGTCGNGLCESNESCGTCLADCNCLGDGGVQPTETVVRGPLEWITYADYGPYSYDSANAVCDTLTANGFSDWRLATREELLSILDYARGNPAFDPAVFPTNAGATMWTATVSAAAPTTDAWVVFTSGEMSTAARASLYSARCVRTLTTPPARTFTTNADGTVTDTRSGLIWEQSDAMAPGTQTSVMAACATASHGTLTTGWRLPTASELAGLVDDTDATNPMLDVSFSTFGWDQIWTSTPVGSSSNFWAVDFSTGAVIELDPITATSFRCVH